MWKMLVLHFKKCNGLNNKTQNVQVKKTKGIHLPGNHKEHKETGATRKS